MTNYDEALSLIEGIEEGASAQQRKPFVIDSTSLSETLDIKQVDYNEVLKEFGIETAPEAESMQRAQVSVQKPVVAPKPEQAKQAAPKPRAKPNPSYFKKDLEEAASRLSVIAKAGSEISKVIKEEKEKAKTKGLVLPTLSINDQISDLEKISEGLKEHAFTKEQIDIIVLEANGLARLIAQGKQPNVPTDLAELRNRLLKEIIDEVGG